MGGTVQEVWWKFQQDLSLANHTQVLRVGLYLILAGIIALYIRFLYERCSGAMADTDPITRTFPLLVLVTTAVISVVKSSLALSLGLVGALSIVRFRAAIKDPEELVYLFFCIAIGLCLGAEQPLLALLLVLVASLFIIGTHLLIRKGNRQTVLLTILGTNENHFTDAEGGILAVLRKNIRRFTIQRYDLEEGQGQIRVLLGSLSTEQTVSLLAQLRDRFPDCQFSYVNIDTTM